MIKMSVPVCALSMHPFAFQWLILCGVQKSCKIKYKIISVKLYFDRAESQDLKSIVTSLRSFSFKYQLSFSNALFYN